MTESFSKSIYSQATTIHLEDTEEWRDQIKEGIERIGRIRFRRYLDVETVYELESHLFAITEPVIVIIDLRMGGIQIDYGGYDWLLERFTDFMDEHASTAVFIISGNLSEGIVANLILRGIPENHIIDKGNWADERDDFYSRIRDIAENMDDVAIRNIADGAAGGKIDPYLKQTIQFRQLVVGEGIESDCAEDIPNQIPMIVETLEEEWDYSSIPDLKILGQIGTIYTCVGTINSIAHLERDPNVLDVEASPPMSSLETEASIPFVKANLVHTELSEKGDRAIIAIVDSGIDITHEAFLDDLGNTRILAIWDQLDSTGQPPNGMSFGTEHSQAQIQGYIDSGIVPDNLKQVSTREYHGTQVASVAAGRASGSFSGGIAPSAKILVVRSVITYEPETIVKSLGYSASHLPALEYIRNFALERSMPVVINISQGMNMGAHDGSSNLEKGFDKITNLGSADGIVIVKSAGNERLKRAHACVYMVNYQAETLEWDSLEPHATEDKVDLWFGFIDQYRFRLKSPEGFYSEWIDRRILVDSGQFPSGNRYSLTLTRQDNDNGLSRLLVVVNPYMASTVTVGTWVLEIESRIVKTGGEIHAWLERSNGFPVAFGNHVSETITLSVPGTARNIITVGSVTPTVPAKISSFSSQGPTRDGREKPELSAPGEGINVAQCNTINGTVPAQGTSLAAPHVSGAIALLLSARDKQISEGKASKQYNSEQIREAIYMLSQGFDGKHHLGRGYGILDVQSFVSDLLAS